MRIFTEVIGFDWDDANRDKNFIKHNVTNAECEEAFGDENRVVMEDSAHSRIEARHYLIGQTNRERLLVISFTVRKESIRIISARDINKKERSYYEN